MTHSIRFHVGRWGADSVERLIERIAEHLRHLGVEAEPGHKCDLFLVLAVNDGGLIGSKQDGVKPSDEIGIDNPVDYQFPGIGQVNKYGQSFNRNFDFRLGHPDLLIGTNADEETLNARLADMVKVGPMQAEYGAPLPKKKGRQS